MARKRPIHPITNKPKREGRRGSRHSSFSDRERYSDSIFRLQHEHKDLREELSEVRQKMDEVSRQSIMEEQKDIGNLSQIMFNKQEKELTAEERSDVFEAEMSESDKEFGKLIEKETEIFEQIDNKLIAIAEEREFLEE